EAGIRDFHVTGVQTCALPIFLKPGVRDGINDAEDRPAGHISCGHVIAVVGRVERRLVNTSHLIDDGDDFARAPIYNDLVRRKIDRAGEVLASHQNIRGWANNDKGGLTPEARQLEAIRYPAGLWINLRDL